MENCVKCGNEMKLLLTSTYCDCNNQPPKYSAKDYGQFHQFTKEELQYIGVDLGKEDPILKTAINARQIATLPPILYSNSEAELKDIIIAQQKQITDLKKELAVVYLGVL